MGELSGIRIRNREKVRASLRRFLGVAPSGMAITPGYGANVMSLARGLLSAEIRDPFRESPWVWKALDWKARNIARLPWRVMKGDRDDPENAEPAPDHPLQMVLERPNRWENAFEHRYRSQVLLDRDGAVFEVMADRTSPAAMPTEVVAVHSKFFAAETDDEGKLLGWTFRNQGKSITFAPWQVAIRRYPDPDSPLGWLSPLEACRRGISAGWQAERFNDAQLRNFAVPRGILTADRMTEPQAKLAAKEWRDVMTGDNALGVAALSGGLKFETIQRSMADMEWRGGLEWNRDLVLIVTGVWPEVFGLGNTTFNNRGEAVRSTWEDTLLPLIEWQELCYWHQLFAFVDRGRYWLDIDTTGVQALQRDLSERFDMATKAFAMGAPPEKLNNRFDLGLEEWEGWDVSYLPISLTPAGSDLDTGPGYDGEDEDPEALEDIEGKPEEIEDEETKGRVLAVASSLARAEAGLLLPLPAPPQVGTRRARRERLRVGSRLYQAELRNVEKQGAAKLSRFFHGLRKQVLRVMGELDQGTLTTGAEIVRRVMDGVDRGQPDAYCRAFSAEDIDLLLLEVFKLQDTDADLRKLMEPIYQLAARNGSLQVQSEIGKPTPIWEPSPEMLGMVESRGQQITRINETTRKRIGAALAEGLAEGETLPDLQDRVTEAFRVHVSKPRALVIARTEVAGAMGEARFQQLLDEGLEHHGWDSAQDEHRRKSHAREHGNVVRIGERFPVTGLKHPLERGGPAREVINCRCRAVPMPD